MFQAKHELICHVAVVVVVVHDVRHLLPVLRCGELQVTTLFIAIELVVLAQVERRIFMLR